MDDWKTTILSWNEFRPYVQGRKSKSTPGEARHTGNSPIKVFLMQKIGEGEMSVEDSSSLCVNSLRQKYGIPWILESVN